jgi:hypothetical protein
LRVDFDALGKRAEVIAPVAAALDPLRLRAVLAKALIDRVVIVCPCRLIAPSARSVSARAWSRIAFSSVMRSFSSEPYQFSVVGAGLNKTV